MTTTADTRPVDLAQHLALDERAQDLLFREARTANAFTDEPVTDDQVRAIHDLVRWAPTSMNTSPLRVTLVRSAEARERVVAHMAEGNKAKTAAAPLVAVLTADHDFHRHLPRLAPHAEGAVERFAAMPGRDEMARVNATLQTAYFILGVRAAGLAAGPMTGFDRDGLTRDLYPAGDRSVVAVVNIGRPAPDAYRPRAARLDYDEVVDTI
ncbi:malonic semialdehyde reductase [Thalassiella azotivora]